MSREDLYVRHQIELAQLTKGELEALVVRFRKLQTGLLQTLHGAGRMSEWRRDRVEAQIDLLGNMVDEFMSAVKNDTAASLTSLASLETAWNAATLSAVASATFAPISGSAVVAAVLAEPFQGQTYAGWWDGLSRRTREHIGINVRQAWALGENLRDAENRILGVVEGSHRNAKMIVRSGVMDVAATAREMTFEEHKEHIPYIIWTSTLDSRTTMPCRIRDGKIYTRDGKPRNHDLSYGAGPGRFHWGCRSTAVPVLEGENPEEQVEAFARPSFDYNQSTNTRATSTLRYDTKDRRIVEKGERNPDAERRGKPTQTTSRYDSWFSRQPAWAQDKILGKRKAALYRQGKMELSTFSEDGVRTLTLKELQERGYQL